jgi:hypothetical protein
MRVQYIVQCYILFSVNHILVNTRHTRKFDMIKLVISLDYILNIIIFIILEVYETLTFHLISFFFFYIKHFTKIFMYT